MRHGKKVKKLGRTAAHRKATLVALSNALIGHKRITTTFAKAKALRGFVEPLINRAKEDTVHNRRQVFRYLRDKESVTELFDNVAEKVGDRNGGYTRVIKLGRRQGDGAEIAVVELVDYNDIKPAGSRGADTRKRTRRGGRRRTKAEAAAPAAVAEEVVEAVDEIEDEAGEESADLDTAAEEPVDDAAEETVFEEPVDSTEEAAVEEAATDDVVEEPVTEVDETETPEAVDEPEAVEEDEADDEKKAE
jgi:large subunit ribosomal protein L17